MTDLTIESAGIATNARQMPNGEYRFYFNMPDDSAYVRTEAGDTGAWQNAHFHKGVRETYIVQAGWMAFATLSPDGDPILRVYRSGGVVSSQPGEQHNVYLPQGAVIHTVKHSDAIGNPEKGGADWYDADPDFDAWCKGIDEQYMREIEAAAQALVGSRVYLSCDHELQIVAIGDPIPRWKNQPQCCPVRFDDGTCGVVWDWTAGIRVVTSEQSDWNAAVRYSHTMPKVGAIGSDVMNIWVTNRHGQRARLRTFYNEKADMADVFGLWKTPEDA